MLRELFIKDFGWKFFSLLLAVFIWFTVHKILEEPKAAEVPLAYVPVTYGEVPVKIVTATASLRPLVMNSNSVSVNVSGAPEVMQILQKNQIHALVDLSDYNTNSKDATERFVEISVPWGVTVVSVSPARVLVTPGK